MKFFAPDKLLPTAPKDSTIYDIDNYGPRPEIFPVEIHTHADYSTGASKAA